MNYISKISAELKRELNNKSNDQKKILLRFKNLLFKKKNYLIKSLCKDVGKNYEDAKAEFNESIKIWEHVIKKLNKIKKKENFIIDKKKKRINTL